MSLSYTLVTCATLTTLHTRHYLNEIRRLYSQWSQLQQQTGIHMLIYAQVIFKGCYNSWHAYIWLHHYLGNYKLTICLHVRKVGWLLTPDDLMLDAFQLNITFLYSHF